MGAPPVWVRQLIIQSFDVDFKQRATLEALCRAFLESAWAHAEALGVGYDALAKEGRLWVLSRLVLAFQSHPRWGQTLELRTWPRPPRAVFALRDFEFVDAAGAAVVGGSSAWLVLDASTRKPLRAEKLLGSIRPVVDRQAIGRDPRKVAAPPPSDPVASGMAVTARYGDLDINQHVNSARYLAWLTDSYPVDFHKSHELGSACINYVGETMGGESLLCVAQALPPPPAEREPDAGISDTRCVAHQILKTLPSAAGGSNTEVCRAEFTWRHRQVG